VPSSHASSSQPSSRYGSGSQRSGYGYSQRSFADEEPEILDLTQADDGPALQLYGTTENKIVGCRYYDGIVSPGELVVLRREPSNPSVFQPNLSWLLVF
jgi:SWI/SNF-related matrix-associated actin-dependent regulator of chromatin subfamily A3